MIKKTGLGLALCLLSLPLLAQEEEENFSSELEVGITNTTGNTEDESFQIRSLTEWKQEKWDYEFLVDAFRSSRQGVLTAQQFTTTAQANYSIDDSSFILSRFSYDDDRFSGFDYQTDFSVSYGRTLLQNREDMSLDALVGAGYRISEEDSGRKIEEPIFRLAGDYAWAISEAANFEQTLSSEIGSENTIYRSRSSIETTIIGDISLRFAITIRHQTDVPANREKTDTRTSVTLVYNF